MYSEKYKNIDFPYTFHSYKPSKFSQFISYKLFMIIFGYVNIKKKIPTQNNEIYLYIYFSLII